MNTSPEQAPRQPQRQPQRHLVPIVASVVGGIVLLGVGGTAALAAVGSAQSHRGDVATQTASMQNVTSVDIESNVSEFTLDFGDVSEATLTARGTNTKRWALTVDNNRLEVTSKRNFFDFCFGLCISQDERATLTLPKKFNDGSLNIEFEVNAGTLTAGGAFRELTFEVNAGELRYTGDASAIDAAVNAGRADLEVQGADTAEFEVSAGRMSAVLTGPSPSDVSLDVSAGKLDLTVPRGTYNVDSRVSAGSLDNQLDTSSRSLNRIDASISAGSAVLREGA